MHEPNTIAARRARALIVIRFAALVLFVLGAIPLGYAVALVAVMRDLSMLVVMWNDTNWAAWGAALLAPALFLFFADRTIVRWLIPVPRRECHECGYPLRGLLAATTRCPECGTAIAAAAVGVKSPHN